MRSLLTLFFTLLVAMVSPRFAKAQCAAINNCDSCLNPTICDACQSGRYFYVPPGSVPMCVTCTACQPGQVEISPCSPFIDRQCGTTCPAGTVNNGGICDDCGVFDCATCTTPGTCTACSPGFFLDAGSCTPCTSCGAGNRTVTACGGSQDTICTECSPGTYSTNGDATSCTACAIDTFATNSGSTICAPCAGGETSGMGQSACDCAAGSMGATGACSLCPAGKFAMTAGSATCMDCSAGTYSSAGSMSCSACAAGTYSDSGASTCLPCAADSVSISVGSATCTQCTGGSVPNATATACVGGAVCGDGTVDSSEACDDHGQTPGDGCSSTCAIETGWSCPSGTNCVPLVGDGVMTGGEECDDGNDRDGDGCSSSGRIEDGWSCRYEPSDCRPSHGGKVGGCSTAGDTMPALPWLALPLAFAFLAWTRRRGD